MKKKKRTNGARELVVAWGSWREWDCVRAALFSSSSSRISAAIDRVAAWQSRAKIPVAVEVTADIVNVQQRDPCSVSGLAEENALPEEMLRMMYAMSIMRLVNGVVDCQSKGGSVAERALKADLPHFLVGVRHDTAHGELPALPLLRAASKQALEWLDTFYWKRQKASLEGARAQLKSKLLDYFYLLRSSYVPYEAFHDQDPDRLRDISCKRASALHKLIPISVQSSQDLVSLLIDDGLLGQKEANSDAESSDVDGLAWRYIIAKLSHSMPELLQMLVLGIVRHLARLEAVADGTGYSFMHAGGASSKGVRECSGAEANRLIGILSWLLTSHLPKVPKLPASKSERRRDAMGLKCALIGHITEQLKCELFALCLRGKVDKELHKKLVEVVAAHVKAASAGVISKLVKLREPEDQEAVCQHAPEEDAAMLQGDRRAADEKDPESSLEELETVLESVKKSQRMLVARVQGRGQEKMSKSSKRRWKAAENWKPCAIGMLPSSCYLGGVRPPWLIDCVESLCSDNHCLKKQKSTVAPDEALSKQGDEAGEGDARDARDQTKDQPVNPSDTKDQTKDQPVNPSDTKDQTEDQPDSKDPGRALECVRGAILVHGEFQIVEPALLSRRVHIF